MLTVVALLGAVLVAAVVALAMCRTREGIVGDTTTSGCVQQLEETCSPPPTGWFMPRCVRLYLQENPHCLQPMRAQCKVWKKTGHYNEYNTFGSEWPWCSEFPS